jgi:hypothetical protein
MKMSARIGVIPLRIRLVAYGASQSPAAFAKMSADVLVSFFAPVAVGSQVEQCRIPSSSTVMPGFGGSFQLITKANNTTAATAFTPSINYEDMQALVSSSSDDGDMWLLTTWSVRQLEDPKLEHVEPDYGSPQFLFSSPDGTIVAGGERSARFSAMESAWSTQQYWDTRQHGWDGMLPTL